MHTRTIGPESITRLGQDRVPLKLATRLRSARGGSLHTLWSTPKQTRRKCSSAARVSSRAAETADQLREIGVKLVVEDGDTIASLSQKYGFSEAKLQQANGGNDTIVPGQKLEFVIKAPDNLMPVSTNQGVKLVSANAAFSDDEEETALAQEHRQIQELQRQHEQRLQQREPGPVQHIVSTGRYLGIGALKAGILVGAFMLVTSALMDWDDKRRRKTRIDDPKVRAEMRRRHGQSFVEHLDQENAQDLAEDGKASPTQLRPTQAARSRPSLKRQPEPVIDKLDKLGTNAAPRAAQINMPQVSQDAPQRPQHAQQAQQKGVSVSAQGQASPASAAAPSQQQTRSAGAAKDQTSSANMAAASSSQQAAQASSTANPVFPQAAAFSQTAAASQTANQHPPDNAGNKPPPAWSPLHSASSPAPGHAAAGTLSADAHAAQAEEDAARYDSHGASSSQQAPVSNSQQASTSGSQQAAFSDSPQASDANDQQAATFNNSARAGSQPAASDIKKTASSIISGAASSFGGQSPGVMGRAPSASNRAVASSPGPPSSSNGSFSHAPGNTAAVGSPELTSMSGSEADAASYAASDRPGNSTNAPASKAALDNSGPASSTNGSHATAAAETTNGKTANSVDASAPEFAVDNLGLMSSTIGSQAADRALPASPSPSLASSSHGAQVTEPGVDSNAASNGNGSEASSTGPHPNSATVNSSSQATDIDDPPRNNSDAQASILPTAVATDASSSNTPVTADRTDARTSKAPDADSSDSSRSDEATGDSTAAQTSPSAEGETSSADEAVTDDSITSGPGWLQHEQVYLPCDEQGLPLNYSVAFEDPDDEEDQDVLLCRLVFESESDLKFVTATLSHVMDQEMEGFSVHPLEVLADAVQAKRPIAFFPAGLVLAAAEHFGRIKNVSKWFDQLMHGTEVIPFEEAQELMASKRHLLVANEQQMGDESKAQEEAEQLQARKDAEAERSRNAISADRIVPPQQSNSAAACADANQSNGAGQSGSSLSNGAGQDGSSPGDSNGAARQAVSSNSSARQAAKADKGAGTPSRQAEQSRANAYAAMRRGESVQLSKDAINQLDQSSLTQRQDLRQEYPNQGIADASDDKSPDDDEDDGLEVYYPPSDSRHSTAAKGRKQSSKMGKGKKRTSGSWERLPVLYVPMVRYRDQSYSFLNIDMAPHIAVETQMHLMAFESRKDAEAIRLVFQANIDEHEAAVHVVPMQPDRVKFEAQNAGYGIYVYQPGQLKVRPGMTDDDLAEAATAIAMQEEVMSH